MNPAQACLSCGNPLQIERLGCATCGTSVEGVFRWSRLARLSTEDQQLVELLILSSGSLKAVAKKFGISYPTMRKRTDELILKLEEEVKEDEKFRRQLVKELESGKRTSSDVARRLEAS